MENFKVKKRKKIYHVNAMNKKTGVAVLMLVKVDIGTRRNARAHNSKCMKQK